MRRAEAFLAGLVLICGAARAEEAPLPDLFDVTGVAAADALNVRSAPRSGSEIIGSLSPEARSVEITAVDDGWGQVNVGERSGWAAMRFLARRDGNWVAGELPPALSCFGAEPFWSLAKTGDETVWSTPDGITALETVEVLGGEIHDDVRRGLTGSGDGVGLRAIISPGACSDGMSDRAFCLTAAVILVVAGVPPRLLHGCCSIAPRPIPRFPAAGPIASGGIQADGWLDLRPICRGDGFSGSHYRPDMRSSSSQRDSAVKAARGTS